MKKKYKKKPGLVNKTGYTPGYDTEKNPVNYIPSESITMANTPYPVKATPLDQNGNPIGDSVVMQPGGEYKFNGASYVEERPFFQTGGENMFTVSGNQPLIIPSQGSYPFDYNNNLPVNEAGMPYITDKDGKKILLSSARKVPTKDEFGKQMTRNQIAYNQDIWNDQKEAYSPGQDDFNAWKYNEENTKQGYYNTKDYNKMVEKFNKLPDVEQEGKCDPNFDPTECGISKAAAKQSKKDFKRKEEGGFFKIKQNNMNSNMMPNFGKGGEKSKWISNKIGILMDEGYPQKQAIAIAYSMYEQKHKNGGYQLPMYQTAGKHNNGNFAGSLTYGQGPNLPTPSTTYDPNKKVDPNAPTPEAIAAYEKQQKAQDQGISLSGVEEYDTTNNALNNSVSGMTNPELMPSKEQLKSNRQQNTATNNYDENGNAINTSELARNNAENSFGGNPLYQFANLEGDMGTDDALFHLGKNVESGNALGIAASATSALLKGGKDFLAGMGSQRRQNYMMKSYYDNQRDNMTGAGREQALRMGGYYQDGGEEKDTPGGMMGRAKMIPELGAVATRQEVEASRYGTNSARDTWEAKTGLPWNEAKRLGYTDGSAKDNMKLLSELNDSRFNLKNLRKTPMTNSTPQLSKNKPKSPTWYKEGKYKKAYDESAFQDDIDRNKQPYPEDIDIVETKKPVAKAPAKTYTQGELDAMWGKSRVVNPLQDYLNNKGTQPKKPAAKTPAKTPQLQKKAPAKTYTKEELDTTWSNYKTYDPFGEMINPDQRNLQSGVITDKGQNMTHVIENGKVVKSFPVLTGQNSEGNKNTYSVAELETNKKGRTTPTGTYLMQPAANIYGKRGFRLKPIEAFGEDAPQATNVALHTLYGTNPNKGEEGYEPEEGRRRTIAINSSNPKDRYKSYGCINGRCEDTEDLADRFPKSDTLISIDSRKSKDRALLSRFGIKKYGGYYQEGGMQPGMEEGMEGQMSNPQEEGMEQQGGGQEQQIMQEVAQALQQGADPQQIVQQLVEMGIPEQQAVQMVQMVMQQLQGGEQQPQQQGTPQLRKGGEMIKRADGSYSRRGMWDNIRDNEGSGKSPTKEMLEQERRIRANKKEMGGYMYEDGGINNPGFRALPDYVQNKILSNMYQEGGEMMDEQMEGEDEGMENESANLEQIESQVEQALKQGADPQQILQQLVQMGIPQEQAIQMIQEILQEIEGGETELEAPEMKNGGSYLNTLKGKTIKDYTYNPKTNSYTVSYE